jgi:hypothetical protein
VTCPVTAWCYLPALSRRRDGTVARIDRRWCPVCGRYGRPYIFPPGTGGGLDGRKSSTLAVHRDPGDPLADKRPGVDSAP